MSPIEQELHEFNKGLLNRCESVDSEELDKKVSSETSSDKPQKEDEIIEQKLEQFMPPEPQDQHLVEEDKDEDPRVSFLDFNDDGGESDEDKWLSQMNDNGDASHQLYSVNKDEEEEKNIGFLASHEEPEEELVEKPPVIQVEDNPNQEKIWKRSLPDDVEFGDPMPAVEPEPKFDFSEEILKSPIREVLRPVEFVWVHPPAGVPKKSKSKSFFNYISTLGKSIMSKTDEEKDLMMWILEDDYMKSNSDVIVAKPGSVIRKTWRIKNSCNEDWPDDSRIVSVTQGLNMEVPKILYKRMEPGDEYEVSIKIWVPEVGCEEGSLVQYISWLYSDSMQCYGEPLIATV